MKQFIVVDQMQPQRLYLWDCKNTLKKPLKSFLTLNMRVANVNYRSNLKKIAHGVMLFVFG